MGKWYDITLAYVGRGWVGRGVKWVMWCGEVDERRLRWGEGEETDI